MRAEDMLPETLDGIWDILRWDLEGMLSGTFNTQRHDDSDFWKGEYLHSVKGQQIAGGKRFAIIQLKQDWEHLCVAFCGILASIHSTPATGHFPLAVSWNSLIVCIDNHFVKLTVYA